MTGDPQHRTAGGGPSPRQPVALSGEQETLFITLFAKALDFRARRSILKDRKADEIARSIDYDFERLGGLGSRRVLVARARQIDVWVQEFLRSRPEAVVLNLGCGLDSRFLRVGSPASVSWFDLDYPEVIRLRRRFYSDGPGYRMLAGSITDADWVQGIAADRPVCAVSDGVFEYLTEEQVRTLLRRITSRFPSGTVIFDVMNAFAVESGRARLKERTGAEFRWAVDDPRVLDALDPRLRRTATVSLLQIRYLPLGLRLMGLGLRLFPKYRDMLRLVRFEF